AGYLPFWSPDSLFIGFAVQGKLKKVEAGAPSGSGPPQTLCEIPGFILGGAWSRDGGVLFSTSVGGLFRGPQAGGPATQLTTLDASQGEVGHMRPWFLPDGRHFLYIARANRPENWAIYLASLDGKERKRLVHARQAGAYAPPTTGSESGHLLFLR